MSKQISAVIAAALLASVVNAEAFSATGPDVAQPAPLSAECAHVRGITLGGDAKIVQKGPEHYYVSCGCAMITTTRDVEIETCRVKTFAKANTSFVVDARDKVTRVLNLSDRHRESLKIAFGNHHVHLNPGDEVAITEGIVKDISVLVPFGGLKYRRPQLTHADGMTALMFEFSLADALKHCSIFKRLRESNVPCDHELLDEIVKTAAAVNTMFAKSREKYTLDGQEEKGRVASGHASAI